MKFVIADFEFVIVDKKLKQSEFSNPQSIPGLI